MAIYGTSKSSSDSYIRAMHFSAILFLIKKRLYADVVKGRQTLMFGNG